jgi:hypothetical protein
MTFCLGDFVLLVNGDFTVQGHGFIEPALGVLFIDVDPVLFQFDTEADMRHPHWDPEIHRFRREPVFAVVLILGRDAEDALGERGVEIFAGAIRV